jgi:hypothetical protein
VIISVLCFTFSTKTAEKATISLAKVGSRAALNFSFAFLRRAWRSGIVLLLENREEMDYHSSNGCNFNWGGI